MADLQDDDKQEEVTAADPGGDKRSMDTSVLSAMQKSFGKAMDELGHVSKLLLVLQADIDQVKQDNAGLRTDVDVVIQRLEAAESRISEFEDENGGLWQIVERNVKKCAVLEVAQQEANFRDRRQNLVLVGLKEKLEDSKPEICVRKIIVEALGIPSSLKPVSTLFEIKSHYHRVDATTGYS